MTLPSELPAKVWQFRADRPIGRGGSATVFRATSQGVAGAVALKIGHDDRERRRLANEAELLVSVESDVIASVVDAGILQPGSGEFAGRPYLALEWVDGAPLDPKAIPDRDRERLALVIARD